MWWIRFRESKEILVIHERKSRATVAGEFPLGYTDRGRAIAALRTSGIMQELGLRFADLELFNGVNTMDEMETWPVEAGFALRHKKDLWFWRHPMSGLVWYSRASSLEAAWRSNEIAESVVQRRKTKSGPAQARLELVRGQADGRVETLENYFL